MLPSGKQMKEVEWFCEVFKFILTISWFCWWKVRWFLCKTAWDSTECGEYFAFHWFWQPGEDYWSWTPFMTVCKSEINSCIRASEIDYKAVTSSNTVAQKIKKKGKLPRLTLLLNMLLISRSMKLWKKRTWKETWKTGPLGFPEILSTKEF